MIFDLHESALYEVFVDGSRSYENVGRACPQDGWYEIVGKDEAGNVRHYRRRGRVELRHVLTGGIVRAVPLPDCPNCGRALRLEERTVLVRETTLRPLATSVELEQRDVWACHCAECDHAWTYDVEKSYGAMP